MNPGPGQRRVTLADVARRAGVSVALASIVMRDAPGASESSRARVRWAAEALGYRPDARARALASLKSNMVGVLFGVGDSFHFEAIDGLYAAAEAHGWNVVLSAITPRRDEAKALRDLSDFRFDALVMLGPAVATPSWAGRLPLVVVGWHVDHPDVDVVRTSDADGLNLAVGHLAALGHRRITHLQGGQGLVASSRAAAYRAAMTAAGLKSEIDVVTCAGERQIDGQRAARSLLENAAERPTAVVAFNDDVAAAAINVFTQGGLSVPGDISVVGFDDGALARTDEFSLTSVRQDTEEMTRLALRRMVDRCSRHEVSGREIVLVPELVQRTTTAPPRP